MKLDEMKLLRLFIGRHSMEVPPQQKISKVRMEKMNRAAKRRGRFLLKTKRSKEYIDIALACLMF